MTFASPSLSLDGAPPRASARGFFRIAGGPGASRVSPALEANVGPTRVASHSEAVETSMTATEATLRRQVEDLTAEVESLRYTLTEVTAPPPDFAEQMVVCRLTKSQAAILSLIIKAGGRTVSHQSLVATLDWLLHRTEDEGTVETIKTQMCHLRQRLAAAGSPIRIRTVWGVGYALETAA